MTVEWKPSALDKRDGFLLNALLQAEVKSDPQIYEAALGCDDRIETEGNALDGVATYKRGPLLDSLIYTTKDGRYVMLYKRVGNEVEIEKVEPSSSNWQP